jgi:hypothetical protein
MRKVCIASKEGTDKEKFIQLVRPLAIRLAELEVDLLYYRNLNPLDLEASKGTLNEIQSEKVKIEKLMDTYTKRYFKK